MNIIPVNKQILISFEEKEEGIILLEKKKEVAIVIASDCEDFKAGERIIISKFAGQEINVDGKEYLLIDKKYILAKIND